MEIYMFLTAVFIEIILIAFCIKTKSYQEKVKGTIRIITFILFVMLVLFKAIPWSFKHYIMLILLSIMGLKGITSLLWGKAENKTYKPWKTILKGTVLILLFFLASLPAIVFNQYEPLKTTGKYDVEAETYTYIDEERIETYTDTGMNRSLNVGFWYPDDNNGQVNAYPLIVFSHGSMGVKTSNESLYRELASHGYVVCSIDHAYHSLYSAGNDGKFTWIDRNYLNDLRAEDAKTDRDQSYKYYRDWMRLRCDDIDFVIDYILDKALNGEAAGVYELVDVNRVGLAGHSLGGSAVLGIGRNRKEIDAVIALEAPLLCDIKGVEDGEFIWENESYPVPLLNIYSDSSWNDLGNWPQYAANNKLLFSNLPHVFNIYIEGAGHLALTDLSLVSPILTSILDGKGQTLDAEHYLQRINKACLEFLDCYLKGEGMFLQDKNDH